MANRKPKITNEFCAMPFLELALRQNGNAMPCCVRWEYVVGNIQKQSLAEIWNSEKMQSLREEFLSGKVVTCKNDIRHKKCNEWMKHLQHKVEFSKVVSNPPIRLDVRLNGQCNLECVMCPDWRAPNGVYNNENFWNEAAREIFPSLEELEVLGGEPFIQKDVYRLMNEVSAINKKCKWKFYTNGQWRFSPFIREHLDRIQISFLIFSIDSLDPAKYSRIRKKGDLSMTLKALDQVLAYQKEREKRGLPFIVAANMVVRSDNYREVPEFIEFCHERQLDVGFNFQRKPLSGSLLSVGADEKWEALFFLRDAYIKHNVLTLTPCLSVLLESLEPQQRLDYLAKNI